MARLCDARIGERTDADGRTYSDPCQNAAKYKAKKRGCPTLMVCGIHRRTCLKQGFTVTPHQEEFQW